MASKAALIPLYVFARWTPLSRTVTLIVSEWLRTEENVNEPGRGASSQHHCDVITLHFTSKLIKHAAAGGTSLPSFPQSVPSPLVCI